jgi:hypothetical protein
LVPIRAKADDLMKNKDYIMDVLNEGAKSCRRIAKKTLHEVREVLGILT